jgi:membrane associated rhomboid family serine protease
MIPLRDTLTVREPAWVNRGIMIATVAVFVVQLFSGPLAETLIRIFGFVPARLFNPERFGYEPWEASITLVGSLFFHGGFVHLGGNLIYLWIFGDDVEDRIGHGRYAFFYVACGVAGSLLHAVLFPSSTIPSIGASGSIAGVLGAFLVLHPTAKIITLFPLVVSWAIAELPAIVFLPVWFLMQFTNGWFALESARATQDVASIAWWAHVGGFLAGLIVGIVARWRSAPLAPVALSPRSPR